jgi:hypothetical protein
VFPSCWRTVLRCPSYLPKACIYWPGGQNNKITLHELGVIISEVSSVRCFLLVTDGMEMDFWVPSTRCASEISNVSVKDARSKICACGTDSCKENIIPRISVAPGKDRTVKRTGRSHVTRTRNNGAAYWVAFKQADRARVCQTRHTKHRR